MPPTHQQKREEVLSYKSKKNRYISAENKNVRYYTGLSNRSDVGKGSAGTGFKIKFLSIIFLQGIKNKLLAFFLRGRPSIDDLFNRGIMKNEPVFGSTLEELQATDLCPVPR